MLESLIKKETPAQAFCMNIAKFLRTLISTEAGAQRCSMKKGVPRNFARFAGKNLCQSVFFNKVADLRPATLLKKRLWHRRFPVSFTKFPRTTFFTVHLQAVGNF